MVRTDVAGLDEVVAMMREQFEAGYAPMDMPPGLEERAYQRWKEMGGVVSPRRMEPKQMSLERVADMIGKSVGIAIRYALQLLEHRDIAESFSIGMQDIKVPMVHGELTIREINVEVTA